MNIRWASHLKKKDEKTHFLETVKSCSHVLSRLQDMLEEEVSKSLKDEIKEITGRVC